MKATHIVRFNKITDQGTARLLKYCFSEYEANKTVDALNTHPDKSDISIEKIEYMTYTKEDYDNDKQIFIRPIA